MSRGLSSVFNRGANDPTSNVAFLVLLTIRHDPSMSLFRAVNNDEDIISRGMTFTAFPFELSLPVESGEELGVAKLSIDNTDLILVDMLRAATAAPRVDIEVILSSARDTVEIAIKDLAMRNVEWDASTITAQLYNENFLNMGFPGDSYDPQEWQGLFG